MQLDNTVNPQRNESATDKPLHHRSRNLLIIEPEPLLRWSLATYLSRWFDVFPTDSMAGANRIVDDQVIDAVVVSYAAPGSDLDALEANLQSRTPPAHLVCMVTDPDHDCVSSPTRCCIEKPFELRKLASLLGVNVGSPAAAR